MAIRVPSRTRLRKYGYVERGDADGGGALGPACPVLIYPAQNGLVATATPTLTWNAVDGATSYNLYLWLDGEEPPAVPVNVTTTSQQVVVEFGYDYHWRVTAVNDFGESSGCTYGELFPDLQDGQSGHKDFETAEAFIYLTDDFYVTNGATSLTLYAHRLGTRDASASFSTANGTAEAGTDYTATSGTVAWDNGETEDQPIPITITPVLVTELAADVLLDWDGASTDPRRLEGAYEYQFDPDIGDPVGWNESFSTVLAEAEADGGYDLSSTIITWTKDIAPVNGLVGGIDTVDPEQRVVLQIHVNSTLIDSVTTFLGSLSDAPTLGVAARGFQDLFFAGVDRDEKVWWSGKNDYTNAFGIYLITATPPTVPTGAWDGINNCITAFGCPYSNTDQLFSIPDTLIQARRVPQGPEIPGSDLPDWPIDPDDYRWDEDTGEIYSKQEYGKVFGDYLWLATYATAGNDVVRKPIGPVLEVSDPRNTQAFWEAAKDAAIADGTLSAEVTTYNSDGSGGITTFPRAKSYAWERSYVQPKSFTVGLSSPVNAELSEPSEATIWITE